MNSRIVTNLTIGFALLLLYCTSCEAQTTSSTISLNPLDTMPFGDHDIGTATPQLLTATNDGDAQMDLLVSISGKNPGDFSSGGKCLNGLKPKNSCQVTVVFAPTTIGQDNGEERTATLRVTNNNGEHEDVTLTGRAFQNLNISPSLLKFEGQVGAASSTAANVRLTNYTNSTVNGITVTATGDFTENHADCSTPLVPGGSCGILITFSPKQVGETSGSLTITANLSNLAGLPRSVSLFGEGLNRCKNKFAFRTWDFWLIPIISGLYFLGLVLVRWHMIAKPARAQLVAEVEAVRARAVAETGGRPDSVELNERLARIHFVLDLAIYPFRYKRFPINPASQGRRATPLIPPLAPPMQWGPTRFFNALFWTRGHELAGWGLIHEAELQLVALLRAESVRARLGTAEQELRDMSTPLALALADQVRESLTSGEDLVVEQARQLLQQFQRLVKPMSVISAARGAWHADLRRRLLNSLQQFSAWAQKNTAPAATADECRSRLQELPQATPTLQRLKNDLGESLDPASLPSELQSLLTEFFGKLIDAINGVPAAVALDSCNQSLAMLAALGTEANGLSKKLNDLDPLDQAKAYQSVLELCKSQGSLVSAMTQVTMSSLPNALLHDLLAALQRQDELIKRINEGAPVGNAAELGNCRDLVLQLAKSPPLPADLLDRIDNLLLRAVPEPLERWRALLVEALSLIYDSRDTDFSQLATWHNKMMWLVGCALLLMFALAVTVGNAVLLLIGAVGGLLSRLTRTTAAADVPNDYGATWGSLFLSPLTGALSAWGGILLIILGVKLNILGVALDLDWCNPFGPLALAIALLFGFSERLFDSVTDQVQDKLLKSSPSSPAPTTTAPVSAAPAPKIISISPTSATIGKEVQLTIRGANFQRGAAASVTKDTGDPSPAKLNFNDATSITVTCTPSGTKAFNATLTITNPDKQVATAKLDVTASS